MAIRTYCSKEIVSLLKNEGLENFFDINYQNGHFKTCSHQDAMKWLSKQKGIHVSISPCGWEPGRLLLRRCEASEFDPKTHKYQTIWTSKCFDTYIEAAEYGLWNILSTILPQKKKKQCKHKKKKTKK